MRTAERFDTEISLNDATGAGDAFGLDHMTGFAVSLRVTSTSGTLTGNLYIQLTASNPFTDNITLTPNPDAIWVLNSAGPTALSISEGQYLDINLNYPTSARGARIYWEMTDGEGNYNAAWFAKGPQS